MAPTKTRRKRSRPRPLKIVDHPQYLALQKRLKAAADEINHHESRGIQQSKEISVSRQQVVAAEKTLARLERRPAAYHTRSQRHVPLCYWANPDLLELLHTIESQAMGERATPSPESGALRYDRIGFPDPLYRHVCEEATARGLVQRYDRPNGAERDPR